MLSSLLHYEFRKSHYSPDILARAPGFFSVFEEQEIGIVNMFIERGWGTAHNGSDWTQAVRPEDGEEHIALVSLFTQP